MMTSRRIDGANVRVGYFTTADGTTIRNGHWCPEGRQPSGSVVLLGGRKEFLENTPKPQPTSTRGASRSSVSTGAARGFRAACCRTG